MCIRACALRLAEQGWPVAVCAGSPEGVDETVAVARDRGGEATGVVADVSTAAAIESLFAHVDAEHGELHALVCNAGGAPPEAFDSLDDRAWLTGYQLTLMSAVRAIRVAIPGMRAATAA